MRRRVVSRMGRLKKRKRERKKDKVNLPGKETRGVRLGKEESRREGSRNDTDPTKLYRLST